MSGVYAAEYQGTRFAPLVRFSADTLNGVPSIVIGVFVYGIATSPISTGTSTSGPITAAKARRGRSRRPRSRRRSPARSCSRRGERQRRRLRVVGARARS
jgi:hypothetical protein